MYKRGALAQGARGPDVQSEGRRVDGADPDAAGICDPEGDGPQAAGVAPLKDVEPQVQEAMYTEAMQPALRAYLTKLREDAYIDIRAGYVDSGASPKETKPVFTAYAPPAVKKKTVQQKKRFDRGTKYSTVTKSYGGSGGYARLRR